MASFSRTFSTIAKVVTGVLKVDSTSGGVTWLGYRSEDIPEEYLVTITDVLPSSYKQGEGKTIVIKAAIQEKITTRLESSWSSLSAASYITGAYNSLLQLVAGRSLVSRFASRRIWSGTTPLDFTLSLKFEAINDTSEEVTKPIRELQRMILPYSGRSEVAGDSTLSSALHAAGVAGEFFLAPPGPNPFKIIGLEKIRGVSKLHIADEGENITVQIGNLLKLRKVIVKDISVDHNPKFEKGGATISAVATVHFQTFEILTKETLDYMYNMVDLKPSKDQRTTIPSIPADPSDVSF